MTGVLKYFSSKTYQHSQGLSCCFRQWKASSHCNLLHGYALQVELLFEAEDLTPTNWVVDFGGLSRIKQFLTDNFDHKLLVAGDDPRLDDLRRLGFGKQVKDAPTGTVLPPVADVIVVPNVGCEAFAKAIFEYVAEVVMPNYPHAILKMVTVREHEGNAAGVVIA